MAIASRIEIHAADHCTQACRYCSHAADIAPKRCYGPEDYVPHLASMHLQGITWRTIDVLGGEPFLAPRFDELLAGVRRYTPTLGCMTNAFWLRSELDIESFDVVFQLLDNMIVTLYTPIVERNGGLENVRRLLGIIRERHPKLKIWHFYDQPVTHFAAVEFHDDRREIVNTQCNFRDCVQLMPDGKLMRCCFARRVERDFAADMTFDIIGDINKQALREWLSRDVLDLCHHCSLATKGLEFVEWTTDPNPRGRHGTPS